MKLFNKVNKNVSYGMSIVCLAAFWIFVYMILSYVVGLLNLGDAITNLICSIIGAIGGIVWVIFDNKHSLPFKQKEPIHMSAFGWTMFLCLFAMVYLSSEVIGNYIYSHGLQVGLTSTYSEMNGRDLYIYVASAITVAPICEELFFRRFVFAKLRLKFSFWIATIVSTLLFIVFHGTLMHIPLAIGLSLMICIFYELTGQFGWCIALHMLFNYLAASYIIVMDMPLWGACIMYVVSISLFILAYVYREKVFGKYLRVGSLAQFEAFLDDKRKHFETIGQTQDGAKQEPKSE